LIDKPEISCVTADMTNIPAENVNRNTFVLSNWRRYAWNSKSLSVMAFLFPFLLLAIAYAAGQTFPFGNRHMLTVDLFHQYAPFLQLFREKILTGGSPFYSLASGLGVSFYALFAYYLASPLNLLLLLFPASFLTEGIFLLTLFKVGLMGFAFFRYLLVSYRRRGLLAVAFSTFYALSGFTLAYSWNIMWLDTLILLPVVVLSLVRLIRDGKWILFPISVTMLLICNYYSAFFASIFIALYFPILLLRYTEGSGISKKLLVVCKVVALVALGVALSAFLLYPTFKSLSLTSAAGDHFPRKFELIGEPLTYLGQLFPFLQPTVRSGAPNLYCGLPVLFLLPMFFLSGRVRVREKILNGLLLLFIFLSFDINILNFLWHGMHYPNQLPYRYSFVAIFLLLSVAYDGLRSTREFRPLEIGLLGTCLVFVAPVVIALGSEIKTAPWTQWGTIILILLYTLLFSSFKRRPFKRTIQVNLLLAVMLFEVALSTFSGVYHIGQNEYFGNRDGYSSGAIVTSIREAAKQTKEMDDDKSFYRMEVKPHKTSNDPALYGLNGLSIFASSSPKEPVAFFKNAGYQNNGINSYQYRGSTLFCDSLFRIKYVIARDTLAYEDHERVITLGNSYVTVYRNDYIFPLAFVADQSLLEYKSRYGDPFKTQGDLADALIGEKISLFSKLKSLPRDGNGVSSSSSTKTRFSFSRPAGNKNWKIELEWKAEYAGPHYLSLDMSATEIEKASVEINGQSISLNKKKKGISEIGSLADGDEIRLLIEPAETIDSGSFEVHLASLDMNSLNLLKDYSRERALNIVEMGEDYLFGNVSCAEEGVLFISIPFDPGWNALVDGKDVEIQTVGNALMALRLSPGSHEIFMYFRPVGFELGLTITCCAAGVFALLLIFVFLRRRHLRKRNEVAELPFYNVAGEKKDTPEIENESSAPDSDES
jgi:uncharacterized membrane protein YfhO